MPVKYFTVTSGPVKSPEGATVATRCLAGVFNRSTGTVKIHAIRARIPALGAYVEASLTGSSLASMPNGTLEILRCTAYSGGTEADAPIAMDSTAAACDVAWIDLPDGVTIDETPLRAIENEVPPAFSSAGLPWSINSLIGAPLGNRGSSSTAVMFRCRSDTDVEGLVLPQNEGLAIRASGEFGTLGMQWLFTVVVQVGSSTYCYQRTVAPGYVGNPWFVLWNTGATTATVLRIEQHNTTNHLLPNSSHMGNMMRVGRIKYPTASSAIADVQPMDTDDELPAEVYVFKDAECSARIGMDVTELSVLDQSDLVLAAPSYNFFLGRTCQLYPRLILPDPQNRDFGFTALTGLVLHDRCAKPIVVAPNTGVGVFSQTFHTLSGNAFAMQLLGGAAVLDIEMVLSYEAAVVATGVADVAFFG